MKRFAAAVVVGALGIYFLVGARNKGISYESEVLEKKERFSVAVAGVDLERPLVVLVRGWLWDPVSRKQAEPLVEFPRRLSDRLHSAYGLDAQILEFNWSRIPTLLIGESKRFTQFAEGVSKQFSTSGHCVNFIGHSAGAAMVFNAAARGVPMGYMGTLGLPTVGTSKPTSVSQWANFYTSTHKDDVAGKWWGKKMRADDNVDLKMPHREFWDSPLAAEISADAIAAAWRSCHS